MVTRNSEIAPDASPIWTDLVGLMSATQDYESVESDVVDRELNAALAAMNCEPRVVNECLVAVAGRTAFHLLRWELQREHRDPEEDFISTRLEEIAAPSLRSGRYVASERTRQHIRHRGRHMLPGSERTGHGQGGLRAGLGRGADQPTKGFTQDGGADASSSFADSTGIDTPSSVTDRYPPYTSKR